MGIVIRSMAESDIAAMNKAIRAQGWEKPADLYANYWRWEQDGTRRIVVAELDGRVAGYLTILPQESNGPFAGRKVPIICDLLVFESFQRQGIGEGLMDAAEAIAAEQLTKSAWALACTAATDRPSACMPSAVISPTAAAFGTGINPWNLILLASTTMIWCCTYRRN